MYGVRIGITQRGTVPIPPFTFRKDAIKGIYPVLQMSWPFNDVIQTHSPDLTHRDVVPVLRSRRAPFHAVDDLTSDIRADSDVRTHSDDVEQSVLLTRSEVGRVPEGHDMSCVLDLGPVSDDV